MTRILIVDDDAELREALRMALEGEFSVRTASSAEDAFAQLSLTRPDAMVLDENLAGLNGTGLLALLDSELNTPPVVMLCGQPDVGLARKALSLGAVDVLAKPCDLGLLTRCLRQVTGRRRVRGADEAPLALRGARAAAAALESAGGLGLRTARFGRAVIAEAVAECRGDRGMAARRLQVSIPELAAFEAEFNAARA